MKITKEFIIEKIKEISKQKGISSLPKKTFIVESGISEYEYLKHFNTWNEAVIAAGLEWSSHGVRSCNLAYHLTSSTHEKTT